MKFASIEADKREFFKQILSKKDDLYALVKYYILYDGVIFGDQKQIVFKLLKAILQDRYPELSINSVFDQDGAFQKTFVELTCPELSELYFTENDTQSFDEKILLEGTENELQCAGAFPTIHYSSSLNRARRPPLSLFISDAKSLFVGPYQFEYFDDKNNFFYPAASSRRFSKEVVKYRPEEVDKDVVLIQDSADGANFAHFLFDWMTRLSLLVSKGECGLTDPIFIMGGTRGVFHDVLIDSACKIFKLRREMFYFPSDRQILTLKKRFMFFSDQKIRRMHPAQLAHPESVSHIKALTARFPIAPAPHARIFITREDAKLRKIRNEHELIEVARKYDFTIVTMSSMTLLEQISVVQGAQIIVGAHGMGLTHIAFRRDPHLSLIELFHPRIGTDAYALIARAYGFKYDLLVGEEIEDNRGSYAIDCESFEKKLQEAVKM
ncbi:glycosyltransferase family 61 protein [Rhodoblastus acidophilus]|uniref:Glycosyltransferase family 61 protein n=1 Tax=Candidatus Rhodoblastus alkanivorans TaxID=2954117 RepID=A0ABS9Z9N9_9HYPH|nr:glycosyltransferase family 61 protein [Candidatus Rhodoblastus alkanivorans]MCI4678891.1 glycosyltransferase family 61 protein [Candidatus Rhodoblastus alkanivorans]MCI4684185.1 glycosyltransferase family 61 protein [Candidatus Rhodoblastus alkanivorans]MDI4641506.1 glycosyltransferase family 61 protein [Rhodoblastus acidophilus]